jgi:hypothetical protein
MAANPQRMQRIRADRLERERVVLELLQAAKPRKAKPTHVSEVPALPPAAVEAGHWFEGEDFHGNPVRYFVRPGEPCGVFPPEVRLVIARLCEGLLDRHDAAEAALKQALAKLGN